MTVQIDDPKTGFQYVLEFEVQYASVMETFMVLSLQAKSDLLILLTSHTSSTFVCSHGRQTEDQQLQNNFLLGSKIL